MSMTSLAVAEAILFGLKMASDVTQAIQEYSAIVNKARAEGRNLNMSDLQDVNDRLDIKIPELIAKLEENKRNQINLPEIR